MDVNELSENVLRGILQDGKVRIPPWAKRVKLDIGTSINAPNSEMWTNRDSDVCVFGFEPNTYNVEFVKKGGNIWPVHLTPSKVDNSVFLINCALGNQYIESADFYCTEGDSGTSSLFIPKNFSVKEKIEVPVLKLEGFFDLFPWEIIEYIEQVKIDAQSSDLDIIKGMGRYLSERAVYLDVETTTGNAYSNVERPEEIKSYMEDSGFTCITWDTNATFVNRKFESVTKDVHYSILGE